MRLPPGEVSGKKGWTFRPDIEGLRAIAVISVLLYHAGVAWAPGGYVGVDVFFVISGFLITGILIDEVEKTGSLDLRRFYARRARRLLPAAGLALVGTGLITYLALPVNRWIDIAGDMFASAFYFINWRLAGRAVDYLASEGAASPVQHFWSLAVEEQYYLVWPLLVVVAGRVAVRRGLHLKLALGIGVALVAVPSFIWSVFLTAGSPGTAYFVTTTRMWELAVGAGLAIFADRLPRLRPVNALGIALLGIAGIVIAVGWYSASTPFPGWRAAVPTIGTALVIAAGVMGPEQAVTRGLGVGAAQWIGARSYSLYLWHWPFVVGAMALFEEFTVWMGLTAVALSVIPASLSFSLVENPIRRNKKLAVPARAFALGLVFTMAGVVAGVAVLGVAGDGESEDGVTAEGPIDDPVDISQVPTAIPSNLTPSLVAVADDIPVVYAEGCHVPHPQVEAISCEFGDPEEPTVVLTGDSHAAQWVPAFIELADSQAWHLVTMTKSACPFLEGNYWNKIDDRVYEECRQWNENVMGRIRELSPDLVVITSSVTNFPLNGTSTVDPQTGLRLIRDGLVERLGVLKSEGIRLAVIRDTPLPGEDVPDCLGRLAEILACSIERSDALMPDVQREAVEAVGGVRFVDLTDFICTAEICPAVVGSRLVWRDNSHLTSPYARALIPELSEQLGPIRTES